jgi:D-inositol-3-phosphate glycosyltransferase
MKIVIIGPVYPYRGGIAHTTTLLYRALGTAGFQVSVVSFRRQYPRWLYPGKTDMDPSQVTLQVPATFPLDPIYPWTWWEAAHQIMALAPEAVIIEWWTTFWAPAFTILARLLRHKGLKVVYLVHNALPHEARFYDRWLARRALSQGQILVALSAREAARLQQLCPQVEVKQCELPTFEISATRLSMEEARSRLSLPVESKVLLFFGIVRPYKGLKVLLEGLAQVQAGGQTPYLMIAGEFWEDVGGYERLIEKLDLTGRVRITNRYIPNEEVGIYFSAANLFIAPYLEGTQSAAIQVALSYHLPVIASESIAAGLPAGIRTFPNGDAAALAQAIRACLAFPPAPIPPTLTNPWAGLIDAISAGEH